jgi:hypothetical protein
MVNDRDKVLLDTVFNTSYNVNEIFIYRELSNSGLKYNMHITEDPVNGGKLRNLTPYYFRVTAFSHSINFDGQPVPSLDRFLESEAKVTVTPQSPIANTLLSQFAGDTVSVTQDNGGSDGIISPIVLDPYELTGDQYRVVFKYDTTVGEIVSIHDSIEYDTTTDTCAVMWDTAGDSIITTFCVDTVLVESDTTIEIDSVITTYWELYNVTEDSLILTQQFNQTGDDDYQVIDGMVIKVAGPELGVTMIREVADANGPLDPSDNVMFSLNSTGDWYIASDAGSDFSRMNWRGLIGTYDWEIRFTAAGSGYYDWITDTPWPARSPFEVWNIGIGTPADAGDDQQINFSIIDDDASGGWSWNDRIYPWEVAYVEPVPAVPAYTFPDDFRIGRIVVHDYSGELTQPAEGTIIRFTTAKINTPADTFSFIAPAPTANARAESSLDEIRAVPNPFYLFSDYDPNPASKTIKFSNLPAECTINIYNLGGDFIRRIEKNDATTSIATWDALTTEGLPVASGIYIFVVEAPGFGQKIGKMAVFTESEILRIY